MSFKVTETFFLPDEIERHDSRIPADLYNLAHGLLARSELSCVFAPIRNLQVLAVVTASEIVFVDSLSYACQDNEGGRVIVVAWQFTHRHERSALNEPAGIEIVFYRNDAAEMQARLIPDFRKALEQMDTRYRERQLPVEGARIVRLGNQD